MEDIIENGTEPSFVPSALLNIFNNSLNIPQGKKLIRVKGVYVPGKGGNYNGYFYDTLRDEGSDASMTLIVPALLRNELQAAKTVHFTGYITRRVVVSGGRIELQINMSELIEQTQNKYSAEDVLRLELQQQKAVLGYRDLDGFLKRKIIEGSPVHIVMLVGKTAIIDQDINHQLEEAVGIYDIDFQRISFTSEQEIIDAIRRNDLAEVDVLVIARGGGEHIQLFDKPGIAKACLHINPLLVTAIGHKDDNPLLQRIADRSFITPTALGQYFNDVYNETIHELQSSKARLVDDITKSLEANYKQQILQLNQQIAAVEKQKQTQIKDISDLSTKEKQLLENINKSKTDLLDASLQSLKEQKLQKEQISAELERVRRAVHDQKETGPNWVAILIALILGLVIGLILK